LCDPKYIHLQLKRLTALLTRVSGRCISWCGTKQAAIHICEHLTKDHQRSTARATSIHQLHHGPPSKNLHCSASNQLVDTIELASCRDLGKNGYPWLREVHTSPPFRHPVHDHPRWSKMQEFPMVSPINYLMFLWVYAVNVHQVAFTVLRLSFRQFQQKTEALALLCVIVDSPKNTFALASEAAVIHQRRNPAVEF
jgi:hypothetical protein